MLFPPSLRKFLYNNLEDRLLIWNFRLFRVLSKIFRAREDWSCPPHSVCTCGVAPAPAAKFGHLSSPVMWVLVEGFGPVSRGGALGRSLGRDPECGSEGGTGHWANIIPLPPDPCPLRSVESRLGPFEEWPRIRSPLSWP